MEHTEHQAALIEKAGALVAEAFRPQLQELERENDRIIGELRTVQRYVHSLEADRNRLRAQALTQEQPYTNQRLPKYVDLPTDAGTPPTIVFDLHGSLTPDRGFPIVNGPWPGVVEAMKEWAARGVCLVVATAALSPDHTQLILDARERLTWEFVNRYGLPVRYVTGKVSAHIFYDDRMVSVDGTQADPWSAVYDGVEKQLAERAELGKDGVWRLVDLGKVGKPITRFPDPDAASALKDTPRGYSSPIFDVDIHRCLLQSNSSENDSELRPGAKEVVNSLYDQGYTIHASCAGWDPATHDYNESIDRLAGLQRTLQRNGVKYDEIVAKLHGTVFVDDKGLTHTDWAKDAPTIRQRMASPAPEDEVTRLAQTGND